MSDKNRLFTDPAVRRRSIERCLELTARYELCGVDIDYEYPDNETQWRRYGVFLRELSDALKKEGRMLSTALSPWGITLQPEEIRCLDYVNIMAYDLGDKQGRHSTYTLADTSIAYFEKLGFSPSKLVLGLAFYGVSTIQVDAPHSGHPYARYVQQFGDRVKTDTNQVEDIYFTGRDMNRDKTLLAIRRGLSGVFYWNFACDIPYEDERCLLRGVGETIRRFTR